MHWGGNAEYVIIEIDSADEEEKIVRWKYKVSVVVYVLSQLLMIRATTKKKIDTEKRKQIGECDAYKVGEFQLT